MSYLDEPEYDDRARDGRSGDDRSRGDRARDDRARDDRSRDDPARDGGRPGGRRAAQPARPAWDAATYGTPDDMRRTRPPASSRGRGSSPPPPPPDPYTPDRYSSDRYAPDPPADPYTLDPLPYGGSYSSDPYPPEPAAPPSAYLEDLYPAAASGSPYVAPAPDTYAPDKYASDQYAPDTYAPDTYSPDTYSPDAYSADAYSSTGYAPSMYAPEPYPDSDPYAPSAYPSDPYPPDPYPGGPHAADPYAADSYPIAPTTGGGMGRREFDQSGTANPTHGYPGGMPAEDAEPKPSGGRAGRNLPAAIGVGVLLGAIAVASLFVWRPAFLGVLAVAVGVGIWELVRAIRTSGVNPPLIPLVAGGGLMMGLAWWGHADALTFGLMVTVLAAMVWRLADGSGNYGRDITAATLVAVYVPFLAGFAALLATPSDGDLRVLVTLAGVVLSDTGGYIAGVLFGRHAMAPSVSPKKSWEGLAGSLIATAIGGALLLFFLFDVSLVWGAVFGVAVSAAAVLGDLGESMIKRDLGVKDMSQLLPGHGGLMDRLDSIVFAAPTAYVLLVLLAPPL